MYVLIKSAILWVFLCFFIDPINIDVVYAADTICKCQHESMADLVERLAPSVVSITTTQMANNKVKNIMPDIPEEFFKFFGDRFFDEMERGDRRKARNVIVLGSGFFIDEMGHIVTNNHVIQDAKEIDVTIGSDGKKTYKAKVVGQDKKTDLALLKINIKDKVQAVKFGDSDAVRAGDAVIAIGNAFGLGGTVTSGIVSAKLRYLENNFYNTFIQTDASINAGNSGGPMFNSFGEVIGVNTAIVSPSGGNVGVGFAIPSNSVKTIVDQLLSGGVVKRGYLGISFQPITDKMMASLSLGEEMRGAVIVSNIMPNSPAMKAGLKVGDIIKKFNGTSITDANQFPGVVSKSPVGKPCVMTVIRDGKVLELTVVLSFSKDKILDGDKDDKKTGKSIEMTATYYGMTVSNLMENVREYYKIPPGVDGVLVTAVDKGANAYEEGIREGDIIKSVNNTTIISVPQFKAIMDKIKIKKLLQSKKSLVITLLILRGTDNFYVSIELD